MKYLHGKHTQIKCENDTQLYLCVYTSCFFFFFYLASLEVRECLSSTEGHSEAAEEYMYTYICM